MSFNSQDPSLRKPFRIFGISSLLIAAMLLATMVYKSFPTASFIHHAIAVQGTVLGQPYQDEDLPFYPRVLFTKSNGKGEVFTSKKAVSQTYYSPGQSVTVLYDPHNPQNARIGGYWSLVQDTLGFLVGIFLTLIPGCFFYFVGTYVLPQPIPIIRQRQGNPVAFQIASFILLLSGIGLGSTSFYFYSNTRDFLSRASHTQGTVIAFHISHSDHSMTFTPEINFKNDKGRPVIFNSNLSSNPPQYSVGDKIDVVFDPIKPSNARVNTFMALWLMPAALCIASIVSLLFSAGMVLAGRCFY
jgi:hypothetical protein